MSRVRLFLAGGRLVPTAAAALIFSAGAFALTASNTVPSTTAGQGSQAISGYTVSNVSYGLDTADPTNISSVSFTLAPSSASLVKIRLFAGGPWYSCAESTGTWTCATTDPQATVQQVTALDVVATQ